MSADAQLGPIGRKHGDECHGASELMKRKLKEVLDYPEKYAKKMHTMEEFNMSMAEGRAESRRNIMESSAPVRAATIREGETATRRGNQKQGFERCFIIVLCATSCFCIKGINAAIISVRKRIML